MEEGRGWHVTAGMSTRALFGYEGTRRVRLNCVEDDQFHVFLKLVKKGDTAGLRRLVESGWDVNGGDAEKWKRWRSPLFWVNGNTAMIRLLLAAGADVNVVNQFDESPLARAASQGHTKAVTMLLRAGARTDVKPYGCSLLTWAMAGSGRNHPKMLQMLREAGATVLHGNTHLSSYPPGIGPVR
jgi:ankyrin repeat protein